ncbi:MAG: thymidylate synthase, partial [Defluviitaleaceae bacterium]|nr:thymidylate synthase [Defluviitaleaceae bacterium]
MKEIFVTGESLPIAYHKALLALYEQGDILSCNDWGQQQKEVSMTYVADDPLREPMVSRLYIGGFYELQQYVMEILDGILDFKISKDKDDPHWEYTYHDRYFRQLPFILSELRRNPDTRRAIMNIRDFDVDSANSDPACLQSIQYLIRGGKLHCKILMRSNDAAQANFMNAFAFIMLQKKVADELGV